MKSSVALNQLLDQEVFNKFDLSREELDQAFKGGRKDLLDRLPSLVKLKEALSAGELANLDPAFVGSLVEVFEQYLKFKRTTLTELRFCEMKLGYCVLMSARDTVELRKMMDLVYASLDQTPDSYAWAASWLWGSGSSLITGLEKVLATPAYSLAVLQAPTLTSSVSVDPSSVYFTGSGASSDAGGGAAPASAPEHEEKDDHVIAPPSPLLPAAIGGGASLVGSSFGAAVAGIGVASTDDKPEAHGAATAGGTTVEGDKGPQSGAKKKAEGAGDDRAASNSPRRGNWREPSRI